MTPAEQLVARVLRERYGSLLTYGRRSDGSHMISAPSAQTGHRDCVTVEEVAAEFVVTPRTVARVIREMRS